MPFTPVTGARLLVHPRASAVLQSAEGPSWVRDALTSALKQITDDNDLSSTHVTFSTAEEAEALARKGDFVTRLGVQFHWLNDNYRDFDDFLANLRQNRRNAIRKERRKVHAHKTRARTRTRTHPDLIYIQIYTPTPSHSLALTLTR